MKTKLLLMLMVLYATGIYSQKTSGRKFRSTEMDTLTVAQEMFYDQNFVMAYPYLNQLQKNHPDKNFLKYMTGICCLFKEDTHQQGLDFLLEVYKVNKRAEDIEFYVALAYHYNKNFTEAIVMIDKFLNKRSLTRPQRRSAEKLKDYSLRGETLEIPSDEGTLDDYARVLEEEEEE